MLPLVVEAATGRPSDAAKRRKAQLATLSEEYAQYDGDESVEAWWDAQHTDTPGRTALDVAAPSTATAACDCGSICAVCEDDAISGHASSVEHRHYSFRNPIVKSILTAMMHRWDLAGNHVGFLPVKEWVHTVQHKLEYTIPMSSAYRQLKAEVAAYNARVTANALARTSTGSASGAGVACVGARGTGSVSSTNVVVEGHVKKPLNMVQHIIALTQAFATSEGASAGSNNQHRFPLHLYDELKQRCLELKDVLGFGPHVVEGFATEIFCEDLGVPYEQAHFVPSSNWCRDFMKQ
jgi:hypothetical protein